VKRIPKVTRAYIRISTQEKSQNSISLELQKKSILDSCSPIVPVFYEDIASAGSVNRPAYKRLLNELRLRDILIVYRLDRLTRNSFDFADLWRGYIQRKKIRFVSVTESYDTRTADGMLQIKLRVDFADFEREIIRTRTREALAEKRKQNLVISRYIPYGYAKRGKYLEPIEEEQSFIRIMKQGRREGKTYEFIARALQRYKIPTKRKKVWRGYVVRDILERQKKLSHGQL
jgi:DNA invertase Pin-like site-specific DNA recombinase